MSGRAWCLSCGHDAQDPQPSMDPAHPLVLCRYWIKGPKGEVQRGCGRVPGTLSMVEAAATVTAHVLATMDRRHKGGKHAGKPDARCPDCAPAIDHRAHLRDRRMVEGCPLCDLAIERTGGVVHRA